MAVVTGRRKAKLTVAQVLAIRASAERNTALAARYGVSHQNVALIKRGMIWKKAKQEQRP